MHSIIRLATLCAALLLNASGFAQSQSAFTYQGRLKLGGIPVTDTCDFRVSLWNAANGGAQLAGPIDMPNVAVDKGLFVLAPDFGFDVWDGSARFLQIAVRSPAGSGSYITLSPRQSMNAVPYSIFSQGGGEWKLEGTTLKYGPVAIAANNYIGVNVTTPQYPLQFYAFQGTDQASQVRFNFTGQGGSSIDVIREQDGQPARIFQILGQNTFNPFPSFSMGMASAHPLGLMTAGVNRLVIDADGRVALGAAQPDVSATLHVGAGPTSSILVDSAIRSSGDFVLQSGTGHWLYLNPFAETTVVGGAGGAGRLGVNRNPATYQFEVEGDGFKSVGGASWKTPSDRRAKTAIATITGALDTLRGIRPVSFRYADWYRAEHPTASASCEFNVIAQEFREVFPNHVHESGVKAPDGSPLLDVDTSPLIPYSVAAIQELDARNSELERTLMQQAAEIAELKAQLARIETLLNAKSATTPR